MDGFLAYASCQQDVAVNEEALNSLCTKLRDSYGSLSAALNPLQPPLRFDSLAAELDFVGLYHLLSIGGMYEHRAVEAGQPSLSDVVLFGLIGAYISSGKLDNSFMSSLSVSDVGQLFSLPMSERAAAPEELSSFVSIEQPGALLPYAQLLHRSLVDTAAALQRLGYTSFGTYLVSILCDTPIDAALSRIAADFPILDDRIIITSTETADDKGTMTMYSMLKNLHRLVYDLSKRDNSSAVFGSTDRDEVESFAAHLTPALNAAAITTLLHHGVIGTSSNEVAVRLVATAQCYRISRILHEWGLEASPFEVSILLERIECAGDVGDVRFVPTATGLNW